jgi:hypothetical protein
MVSSPLIALILPLVLVLVTAPLKNLENHHFDFYVSLSAAKVGKKDAMTAT